MGFVSDWRGGEAHTIVAVVRVVVVVWCCGGGVSFRIGMDWLLWFGLARVYIGWFS